MYDSNTYSKRKTFVLRPDDRERFAALSRHFDLAWADVLRLAVRRLVDQLPNTNAHTATPGGSRDDHPFNRPAE